MTEKLDYAMSVVRHLESVATTPDLRAAFNAVQPKVSAFYSSLPLNEALEGDPALCRDRGGAVRLRNDAALSDQDHRRFKRHGAELDAAGKTRLQEIDVALAEVTTKFSENVLDSTNAWDLVIDDEAQLTGLPPARSPPRVPPPNPRAEGWRFTLQAPSYHGSDDLPGRRGDS